jgi:hypothetical protein
MLVSKRHERPVYRSHCRDPRPRIDPSSGIAAQVLQRHWLESRELVIVE